MDVQAMRNEGGVSSSEGAAVTPSTRDDPSAIDARLEQEWGTTDRRSSCLDEAAAIAIWLPAPRMLVWSSRLRSVGRPAECPLVAVGNDETRSLSDRALAAATAWALAKDRRAAAAIVAIVDRLTAVDRLPLQQLATDLVDPMPGYYLHPRPEILALIPGGAADLLELGCAAGILGQTVKARQRCRYTGVEMDPLAARIAANGLDHVTMLDLDDQRLPFELEAFDCVICADVLEHVKDPWAVLAQLFGLLRPGGRIIVSIPNIRNLGVMAQLAAGEWEYQDAGILDRTHLRFFTRRTFERALLEAGFLVELENSVLDPSLQVATTRSGSTWKAELGQLKIDGLSEQDAIELATIQILYVASRPASPASARSHGETSCTGISATVVIPVWNRWDQTGPCLDSLRRTLRPGDRVVVVDNGSADGTAEGLRSMDWLHVISNSTNRGFAAACNQGAAWAAVQDDRCGAVVFLNNDTLLAGHWLDALMGALAADPTVGAAGPRSNFVSGPQLVPDAPYGKPPNGRHRAFVREWEVAHRSLYRPTTRLVGFALAVRQEVLDAVGVFDEDFGIGGYEDDDLCERIRAAGWSLVIADESFVHHAGHATFDGNGLDWMSIEQANRRVFEEKRRQRLGGAIAP